MPNLVEYFPEVASRQHIKTIYPVIDQALHQAHLTLNDLDAIAVTRGPGLPGSLVVGMNAAKGLVLGSGLPIIGVSHLEGHLYSAWLYKPDTTPTTCTQVSTDCPDRIGWSYRAGPDERSSAIPAFRCNPG